MWPHYLLGLSNTLWNDIFESRIYFNNSDIITYYPYQKDYKIIIKSKVSSVLFGDSFIIDNIFIDGSCNLSYYYGDLIHEKPISSLNPFVIEIYIVQFNLGINTYMYLVNGTILDDDVNGNRYSVASNCYLCKEKILIDSTNIF